MSEASSETVAEAPVETAAAEIPLEPVSAPPPGEFYDDPATLDLEEAAARRRLHDFLEGEQAKTIGQEKPEPQKVSRIARDLSAGLLGAFLGQMFSRMSAPPSSGEAESDVPSPSSTGEEGGINWPEQGEEPCDDTRGFGDYSKAPFASPAEDDRLPLERTLEPLLQTGAMFLVPKLARVLAQAFSPIEPVDAAEDIKRDLAPPVEPTTQMHVKTYDDDGDLAPPPGEGWFAAQTLFAETFVRVLWQRRAHREPKLASVVDLRAEAPTP